MTASLKEDWYIELFFNFSIELSDPPLYLRKYFDKKKKRRK